MYLASSNSSVIITFVVPITEGMILEWKENEAAILKKTKADNGMLIVCGQLVQCN